MITRDNIINLAKQQYDTCVSIYLPTHKMGEEVQQDPIRLKNLLGEAEEQLKEKEVAPQDIDKLLEGPRKLLDKPLFWQHNDKGLALFISDEDFDYYRIPHNFKERVMVGNHFLITPLIPMSSLEGSYCVLTLSQKNIRLLKCTRASVEEIAIDEAPGSFEEFQKFDVFQKQLQHHSGQGSGNTAIFHGHGGAEETDTEMLKNYLKTIENEVTSIMRKRNDPLILAGVSGAIAEYRKINHYRRLMEKAVTENTDPKSNEVVKEEGWKVIQSHFLKDMYDDIRRFGDLTGSDKHCNKLINSVEAAYYSKIDSLFVPIGEHSWGWFDQERDVVHHSTKKTNGEYDLINMAAIKTLTQGGSVYALDREEMPNQAPIAAIFRYV